MDPLTSDAGLGAPDIDIFDFADVVARRGAEANTGSGKGSDPGPFFSRYGGLIASFALLGVLAGAVLAFLVPAQYRSQVGVLITTFREGTSVVDSLAADAEFVNSVAVLNRVRAGIPHAPERVTVEVDPETQILRLTASGDSADDALRLARNWTSAFQSERRVAVAEQYRASMAEVEAEIDGMAAAIGTARLAADDAEAARLDAQRNELTARLASLTSDLSAIESGGGTEVVENADRPSNRAGIALLPASLLGAVIGALSAGAFAASRDRESRRNTEAEAWLDPEHHPMDLVELAEASAKEAEQRAAGLEWGQRHNMNGATGFATPQPSTWSPMVTVPGDVLHAAGTPAPMDAPVAMDTPAPMPVLMDTPVAIDGEPRTGPMGLTEPVGPLGPTGPPEPTGPSGPSDPVAVIDATTSAKAEADITGAVPVIELAERPAIRVTAGRTQVRTSDSVQPGGVRVVNLALAPEERDAVRDNWADDLSLLAD